MSADAKCDQPPTKVNDEQKVTTSAQENDDQATSQHKMACNLANYSFRKRNNGKSSVSTQKVLSAELENDELNPKPKSKPKPKVKQETSSNFSGYSLRKRNYRATTL